MIATAQSNENLERLRQLDEEYFRSKGDREAYVSTYESGETSRMNPVPRGVDPLGADADTHYRTERNYFLHVERGRAAVRNHPLVEQGINRLIANVRLDGFTLDIDSGDETIDAGLQDDWKGWCGETSAGKNLCDYEGSRTFQQIARQSFFSRCSDGDITHVPLVSDQIQTWESHHTRTPFHLRTHVNSDQNGIVHGAEVRNGKTIAYWLTPQNLTYSQSLTRSMRARRFPVFDQAGNKITFWMGFRHRFFQRRGINRLSAPRDAMNGFADLNYSHIKSNLRRSLISYLMEDSAGSAPSLPSGINNRLPQSGPRRQENEYDPFLGVKTATIEQSGEPAQIIKTPDGKTIKGWNANLPGDGFFQHAALLLNMLAVNLDLPLSFLLLDGSMANFHGGRMIFDQVKLRLQQIQKDEIQGFWGPTYEWRIRNKLNPQSPQYDRSLAEAYESGRANPFSYTFRPLGWPYVKPAEDAAAEDLAERRNLRSHREILAARGLDLDQFIPTVISDRASWFRYSLKTARRIAEQNADLDINVLELASELRYGQKIAEQVVKVGGSSSASQMADEQNRTQDAAEASA